MDRAANALGGIKSTMRRRWKEIVAVVVWAIVIVLIVVKTHQSFYIENVKFATYGLAYRSIP